MDDGCQTVTVEEVICKVDIQNRFIRCKGIEKKRTGAVPDYFVGQIDLLQDAISCFAVLGGKV